MVPPPAAARRGVPHLLLALLLLLSAAAGPSAQPLGSAKEQGTAAAVDVGAVPPPASVAPATGQALATNGTADAGAAANASAVASPPPAEAFILARSAMAGTPAASSTASSPAPKAKAAKKGTGSVVAAAKRPRKPGAKATQALVFYSSLIQTDPIDTATIAVNAFATIKGSFAGAVVSIKVKGVAGSLPSFQSFTGSNLNLKSAVKTLWAQVPSLISDTVLGATSAIFPAVTTNLLPDGRLFVGAAPITVSGSLGVSFGAGLDLSNGLRMINVSMPSSVNLDSVAGMFGVTLPGGVGDLLSLRQTQATFIRTVSGTTGFTMEDGTTVPAGFNASTLLSCSILGITDEPVSVFVSPTSTVSLPKVRLQFSDTLDMLKGVVKFVRPTFESTVNGFLGSFAGTFAGTAISANIEFRGKTALATGNLRFLVQLSAPNVNLKSVVENLWKLTGGIAPTGVTSVLQNIVFPAINSVTMPDGRIFVTAGPMPSGTYAGAAVQIGLDDNGLRLINVTLPGTVSPDSILASVGAPASASSALTGIFSLSQASIVFVTAAGTTETGFTGQDGTYLLSGLNATALVSVPLLDMTNAQVDIFVGTGSSAGQVRIAFDGDLQLFNGVLVFNNVLLTNNANGFSASIVGKFAGVAVSGTIDILSASAAVNGRRLFVNAKATNVNLKSALLNLWPDAPSFLTDTLAGITFAEMSTNMLPDGRIFVSAGPVNAGPFQGASFQIGLDDNGFRMANITVAGTLTPDTILSSLGASGVSGLGDIISVSNAGVTFVRSVTGSQTFTGLDGTVLVPGINGSAVMSIPFLQIANSRVTIFIGTGSLKGTVKLQFPDELVMLNGLIKLVGPSLETSPLGFTASLPGTFAGVTVSAVMDLRSKLNAINGERVFVKLSATDVNLKNMVIELFKVGGSVAPTVITDALNNVQFPNFKTDQLPGGRWFVTAGPISLPGASFGVGVKVAVDKTGLRMLNVTLPGSVSIDSIMKIVGAGSAPPGIGDLFTIKNGGVVWVLAKDATAGDFVNDDDSVIGPGFNGTATVSIPILGIDNALINVYVGTGVNKGKLLIESPSEFVMFKGIIKLIGPRFESVPTGYKASLKGQFLGIDIAAEVDLRNAANAINGERVFVNFDASNVNLATPVETLWKLGGGSLPSQVKDILAPIMFPTFNGDQLDGGRLFVYAGPLTLGANLGVGVKVGIDKNGLRLLNVTFPGTLSIESLASIVGASVPPGLGDIFSMKDAGVLFVPARVGLDDFENDDGTTLSPGINGTAKLSVSLLGIKDSLANVYVGLGANKGKLVLEFPDQLNMFNDIIKLVGPRFEASSTGYLATLKGSFLGTSVAANIDIRNRDYAVDGQRTFVHLEATNINLGTVVSQLWALGGGTAPSTVTDTLSKVTFEKLTADTLAGNRLFVYAGPVNFGASFGVAVKVGVDKSGLRLLNVTFPGTVTIDSILSMVGAGAAPAGLGDIFSIKNASVIYVPSKAGLDNFINDDDDVLIPGINGSALVSISLLGINDAPVDIYVGTGTTKGKLLIECSGVISMFKGIIKLNRPRFESVDTGYLATLGGTFASLPVNAILDLRNKLNAIKGERKFVKLSATNLNLKNAIMELWRLGGSEAPDAVTNFFNGATFPQFKADTLPGSRLFVYAGPLQLGASLGLGVKVAVDNNGLRLLNLTFPGTLSIDSLLSIVGASAPPGIGDIFSITNGGIIWVPSRDGEDGFLNDDDTVLPFGFNGTAMVSIPLLGIQDALINVYVGTGNQKGKLLIECPTSFSMFNGILTLIQPRFESTSYGYLATLGGVFAYSVQIQARIEIRNKANAVGGERVFVTFTAQNINIKNVIMALWPGAPEAMLGPLDKTMPSFRAETSPGGRLFVEGTLTLTAGLGLTARIGIDPLGLRLINASLPGTLTIDSLLAIVGIGAAPPGLGDLFSIKDANVMFVPNYSNTTGFRDEDNTWLWPGFNASATVSVPLLGINDELLQVYLIPKAPGSLPSVSTGASSLLNNFKPTGGSFGGFSWPKLSGSGGASTSGAKGLASTGLGSLKDGLASIRIEFPDTVELLNGYIKLDRPVFETVDVGYEARLSGSFLGITVNARVVLRNKENAGPTGRRLSVEMAAKNVNLKTPVQTLWPEAPSFVLDTLGKATFEEISTNYTSDGRLFVAAGPITFGTSLGVAVRVGIDSAGLRVLNITLTGTWTIDAVLQTLGTGVTVPVLGDLFSIKQPAVIYVPTKKNKTTGEVFPGFTLENGTMLLNGINASALVSVPLLDIVDSPVWFSYTPGSLSGAGNAIGGAVSNVARKIRFQFTQTIQLFKGIIKLPQPTFETIDIGYQGILSGQFAGVTVDANIIFKTKEAANGGQRLSFNMTARNVNMKNVILEIWSGAPDFVLNSLGRVNFEVFFASWNDGRLVIAGTTGADFFASTSFKVTVDKKGLRFVNVTSPGTVSIDTILMSLGVTSGTTALSDVLTLTRPAFLYIRKIDGEDVYTDENGDEFTPGVAASASVSVPFLGVNNVNVDFTYDSVQKKARLAFPNDFSFFKGIIKIVSPVFESSSRGLYANVAGDFAGITVQATVEFLSKDFRPPNGQRLTLDVTAYNVNLRTPIQRLWPEAPDAVLSTFGSISFGTLNANLKADGRFFLSAGPITVGTFTGAMFQVGIDSNGFRMINVTMPGTISPDSIISSLGGPSGSLGSLGDVISFTGSTMQYVREAGSDKVFLLKDDSVVSAGFNASTKVSIPLLSISQALCRMSVAGNPKVIRMEVDDTLSWFDGLIVIDHPWFEYTSGVGFKGSMTAIFAGTSVTGIVEIRNKGQEFPGGARWMLSLTANRIQLGSALKALWPDAPSMVVDKLNGIEFPKLSSTMYGDGRLYVTVGPVIGGIVNGLQFDIGFDKGGLRMLSLTLGDTPKFGGLLSGLGVPSIGFDVDKAIRIRSPGIVYVKKGKSSGSSSGSSGSSGTNLFGGFLTTSSKLLMPMMNISLEFSLPVININNFIGVKVPILDGNGKMMKKIQFEAELNWSPIDHITVERVMLGFDPSIGIMASAKGKICDATVEGTVKVFIVKPPTKGLPFSVNLTATNLYVSNIISTMFPSTPDVVIAIFSPFSFEYLTIAYSPSSGFFIACKFDWSKIPIMATIMKILGDLSFSLRVNPVDLLIEIAVNAQWVIPASSDGQPFPYPTYIRFQVAIRVTKTGVEWVLSAGFRTSLKLSFLQDPGIITFGMAISITFDVKASVFVELAGLYSGEGNGAALKNFDFILVKFIFGSIAVDFAKAPAVYISGIQFKGNATFFRTTNIFIALAFDANSGDFGLHTNINVWSMGEILVTMNVLTRDHIVYKVLDGLLSIRNVTVNFAVMDIYIMIPTVLLPPGTVYPPDDAEPDIPMGFQFSGYFKILFTIINIDVQLYPTKGCRFFFSLNQDQVWNDIWTEVTNWGRRTFGPVFSVDLSVIGLGRLDLWDIVLTAVKWALQFYRYLLLLQNAMFLLPPTSFIAIFFFEEFTFKFSLMLDDLDIGFKVVKKINLFFFEDTISFEFWARDLLDFPRTPVKRFVDTFVQFASSKIAQLLRIVARGICCAFKCVWDLIFSSNKDYLSCLLNCVRGSCLGLMSGTGLNTLDIAARYKDSPVTSVACRKPRVHRGSSSLPDCPEGMEAVNGICYGTCAQSWTYGAIGRGANCYQQCPPGFVEDIPAGDTDLWLTCSTAGCDAGWQLGPGGKCYQSCKDGENFIAGKCYTACPDSYSAIPPDASTVCEKVNCTDTQELIGGVCYDKCKQGFTSDGGALCLADCPANYTAEQFTCFRDYQTWNKPDGQCCRNSTSNSTGPSYCGCDGAPGSGWVDMGCFCARFAERIDRGRYWRGSSSAGSSQPRPSYEPPSKVGGKKFTRQYEARTVGQKAVCSYQNSTMEQDGWCYLPCPDGWPLLADFCYRNCPPAYKDCGAFCVPDGYDCATYKDYVLAGDCADKYSDAGSNETSARTLYNPVTVDRQTQFEATVLITAEWERGHGESTKPYCTTGSRCMCWGVKDGLSFPAVFNETGKNMSGIVTCKQGLGLWQPCGGDVDDAGNCAPTPTLMSMLAATVSGDGSASGGSGSGGGGSGDGGLTLGDDTGPIGGSSGAKTPCTTLPCSCEGKPDGLYPNTFSDAYKAAAAAAASSGGNLTLDDALVAAVYASYIECKANGATAKDCATGNVFNVGLGKCVPLPPSTTKGAAGAFDASCTQASCFCDGRADGVYALPGTSAAGVVCSMQKPRPFTCPDGFVARDGLGCAEQASS